MTGGGICEFGARDGAVGIDLHADVDADGAPNGGAGLFGDFGEDFAQDSASWRVGGGRRGMRAGFGGRRYSGFCLGRR